MNEPSQNVVQMYADQLMALLMRGVDESTVDEALNQLRLSWSGCGVGYATRLAEDKATAKTEMAEAKDQFTASVPDGYGKVIFGSVERKHREGHAWLILAVACES